MRRNSWHSAAFIGTFALFGAVCIGLALGAYHWGYQEGLQSCAELVERQEAELAVLRGWYENQRWLLQDRPPPASHR